jgi:hypothetical protein
MTGKHGKTLTKTAFPAVPGKMLQFVNIFRWKKEISFPAKKFTGNGNPD